METLLIVLLLVELFACICLYYAETAEMDQKLYEMLEKYKSMKEDTNP